MLNDSTGTTYIWNRVFTGVKRKESIVPTAFLTKLVATNHEEQTEEEC